MSKVARILMFSSCCALAACAQAPQALAPSALEPAPVAPVATSQLPPPNATTGDQIALANSGQTGSDLQAIPELPSAINTGVTSTQNVTVGPDIEFDRTAILGAWNVAASQDVCALNLSLTTWTGGFRASTRKCTEETLAGIGAWSLSGKQLTLFNAQGSNIANLFASGPNRFDGTTTSGSKAITVFR